MSISLSAPDAANPPMASAQPEIRVWDRFVRVFHWSVVGLFVVAFVTGEDGETLHQVAGYGILALVVLRLGWGFIGPDHARFASFIRSPRTIVDFLTATARMKAPRYVGHNPAGGLMVLALIVMLIVITATGIAQTLEAYQALDWIEDVHEGAVLATLALIGLHLIGVLVASVEHGENLVRAMFTGRKRAPTADKSH